MLLKLDQDLSAEMSKASCADESVLHNTIKSQDGEHEQGNSMRLSVTLVFPDMNRAVNTGWGLGISIRRIF